METYRAQAAIQVAPQVGSQEGSQAVRLELLFGTVSLGHFRGRNSELSSQALPGTTG